eukprot:scaffold18052_cov175-Amphora_coffeaeformis.AAC.4
MIKFISSLQHRDGQLPWAIRWAHCSEAGLSAMRKLRCVVPFSLKAVDNGTKVLGAAVRL